MISWYKGYKIITSTEKHFIQYDIYRLRKDSIFDRPPVGDGCEAVGFLMDDFGGEDMAVEYARNLIDTGFQTRVLREIRETPKGVARSSPKRGNNWLPAVPRIPKY